MKQICLKIFRPLGAIELPEMAPFKNLYLFIIIYYYKVMLVFCKKYLLHQLQLQQLATDTMLILPTSFAVIKVLNSLASDNDF